ncbi:MAG: ABC transporter permease, partial [Chloroflexi bacterium]|nr:ABC transporter permease [Chloroflexota bacterium]
MNIGSIVTIIRKEWAELYKNTLVLSTVLFLPLFLAALPLIILWVTADIPVGADVGLPDLPAQLGDMCQNLTATECTQVLIAGQFTMLFMMIPLIIPSTVAPYSIVGEKTQHSLEPLLATPISTIELLLGKNLASVIPAVLATWLAFLLYAIGVSLIAVSSVVARRLLAGHWIAAVLIAGPLLAIFAVNVTIMISARSTDPRAAQQVASLVVLPLILLFVAQLAGVIVFSPFMVAMLSAGLVVIDAMLFYVTVQVFDREAILTRW